MQKRFELPTMMVMLFLAAIVVAGCAKQTPVAEESFLVSKETPAATAPSAAATAPSAAASPQEAAAPVQEQALPAQEPVPAQQLAQAEVPAAKQVSPAEGSAAARETVELASLPTKSAIDMADVHFDFDQSTLTEEARGLLKRHADWLLKNRDYALVIEGHCDERGTTEYNLALGQRRAAEAMKFLADLGVDPARMRTISYGKEMPLDQGHTEEAWAKNRCAHFLVNPQK
jgi:peptidoglycan-associated lipoprotein